MSADFETVEPQAVTKLVADHPLAWILPVAEPLSAILMPVLCETDASGAPVSLLGHLPLRHPMVETLRADRRAMFLFLGPNAYISPEWLSDKDWAPTWNFASARMLGDIQLSSELTDEALEKTVAHMERSRPEPWTAGALGSRYTKLREQVIGFRATITGMTPRFKLGQDERPEVFGEIIAGLDQGPIAAAMQRARQDG